MSETASLLDHQSIWGPMAQQRVFRCLLEAFSYPGRIQSASLPALLATLGDSEISLADPDELVAADDWRRLGARREAADKANFVVARGDIDPAFQPAIGTLESPEQGATILLRVRKLGRGAKLKLSGPGIQDAIKLAVGGLDPAWLERRAQWNAGFPMGVDFILVDGEQFAALPRTVSIAGEA
ncbi:MAG: phosphonate C-P lyase system protein PhnH [Betaproteobacteria bacterium]|nr:phosphonate C-P lyase system protein PhnH [Betaproteobacteria bacterium]